MLTSCCIPPAAFVQMDKTCRGTHRDNQRLSHSSHPHRSDLWKDRLQTSRTTCTFMENGRKRKRIRNECREEKWWFRKLRSEEANKQINIGKCRNNTTEQKVTIGTVASIQTGELAVDARSLQVAGCRAATYTFPVLQTEGTLLCWSQKSDTT